MVLSKRVQYTQITPIPSFIPRELAIDFLHGHGEILELNPLVTGYEAIKAPRDAPADEFYSTWYEISQRIQYIPGAGKLGSGAIKFRGVFHDLPFGLQTHTYCPANVDLRNKWQICGNQPGEPPEPKELGSSAPPEGLYIREDVEIKCNLAMVSFVKKEMKAAAKVMLERLVKKAELLDKGALQAMMENGRLKTVNPADRSVQYGSPGSSPALTSLNPASPSRAYSVRTLGPGQSPYQQPPSPYLQNTAPTQPAYVPPQQLIGQNSVVMELPGDFSYTQQGQAQAQGQGPPAQYLQPDNRNSKASSVYSTPGNDARWSAVSAFSQNDAGSRPSSYAPSEGFRSPPLESKSFAAELPTMEETREEHEERKKRESQLPSQLPRDEKKQNYDGADYGDEEYVPAPAPLYSRNRI